jgi:beta-glucosidase/6-phospho-beta-glucosidase/beta-galactosidase
MYKCGHHLLLAHGKAYDLYHKTPQVRPVLQNSNSDLFLPDT